MVIALLGVISWVVPDCGWHIGKHTLRWPTLAEALDLTNEGVKELTSDSLLAEIDTIGLIPADSVIQQDTLALKDSVAQKSQPIIPKVNVANTDSRAYLAAFYAALDSASSQSVRVVHYGDSQIEEDRITNVLRERWQKAYGGGGVGLIPLHQTIPNTGST
jgi:hypothetical protein